MQAISPNLLPPNHLDYDYSTSEFIQLSSDRTNLNCRNGIQHHVDFFHSVSNGAMTDQNAIEVDNLVDLNPGLRLVLSSSKALIDSNGLSNNILTTQRLETREPFTQVTNYFEVTCNFTGSKNVQCFIINKNGVFSNNLQITILGPTICGVMLDYSESRLLIMDVIKSKKLYSYQIDFTSYPPPLKFAFDSHFQFYVNPHASFENLGEFPVLNSQIYGPNVLPLLKEDLDFSLLKVVKSKSVVELKKSETITESIDIGSGYDLTIVKSKEALEKDKFDTESLYTDISTDFTNIIKSPLLKLAYNKLFQSEEESAMQTQLEAMRSVLNTLHNKTINDGCAINQTPTKYESTKFFQNPWSNAITAIQGENILRNLPKFCLNESEKEKINTFPYLVKGFNVQNKTDEVTVSFQQASFINQMKILNKYIERVFRVSHKTMIAPIQRFILKIVENISKNVQNKCGRIQVSARFVDLVSFTSLLMSSCYDKLGSKNQKSDESVFTKLKGSISKLQNKAKNKNEAGVDQVVDVDSDSNSIGIGGLFGESSDQEVIEPPKVKRKKSEAKVEKKEEEKKQKEEKKIEEEEKRLPFSTLSDSKKLNSHIYFEALRSSLIMDEILYCASNHSKEIIQEFWPLISRPHSILSTYSSLSFNNGDGSPLESLVLDHGHTFLGGQISSLNYAGAVINPRRCPYSFMPEMPKARRDITLLSEAYPLSSYLLEYATVPLAVTLSHCPSIKFKDPITHIRLAESFPLFAVATKGMEIYLLFSVFKIAGPQSFDALKYTEIEIIEAKKKEESKEQSNTAGKVEALKGDDQAAVDQVIEDEQKNSENQGMFGNLFDQRQDFEEQDKIKKFQRSFNKQKSRIIDFATRLTIQTCYFYVLIKDEEDNLRLSIHTILDKHSHSCNSAMHYDVTKQKFSVGTQITSRPLKLAPDVEPQSWVIKSVEQINSVQNKSGFKIYLYANQIGKNASLLIESSQHKISTDKYSFIKIKQIKVEDVASKFQTERKKKIDLLQSKGIKAIDACQEQATGNIVYADENGEIKTFSKEQMKAEEAKLCKQLIENGDQEDALQIYPSALMNVSSFPDQQQDGSYIVKTAPLPSSVSSVSLSVFFESKSLQNLSIQKNKLPKALLEHQDFQTIPKQPIGLELVNLNDDPSIAAKHTSKISYTNLVKPNHSSPVADVKLQNSNGGKSKLLYRTFNGNAAYITSITLQGSSVIKAATLKMIASNTLDGLCGVEFQKIIGQVRGCTNSLPIPESKKQFIEINLEQPLYGKYFLIQITSGGNIFQGLQLRGVEIKDFSGNYSSATEYFSGFQVDGQNLNINNWTDLYDQKISFSSVQIPVSSGNQPLEFKISKVKDYFTSLKPIAYQLVVNQCVQSISGIYQSLRNFESQEFASLLKQAVSQSPKGIKALSCLGRLVAYENDGKLLAKIKDGLNYKNLIRAIILRSECASDIFNLLNLAKFLLNSLNNEIDKKNKDQEFRKEVFYIAYQILCGEKLYLTATHQNVSLIGLQFAVNAFKHFYPNELKEKNYTLDLIKSIYQDVYLTLAKKVQEDSKFVNRLKNLIEGLPGVRYMKNQSSSANYLQPEESKYTISEGPRVISHFVCKFTKVNGLFDPEVGMIKNNNERVYFSNSFLKPGARCVTFQIHDIGKTFDIGFSQGFSGIFCKLAGRNPNKLDFKPHVEFASEMESDELGENALKTILAMLNAQTITQSLTDRLHSDTKPMDMHAIFMEMKDSISSLIQIPYFRNSLLGLLSSQSGENIFSHQLTANLLEALRLPFIIKREQEMKKKSVFEDEERQSYEEMIGKYQAKAMKKMSSTIKMLQNLEINASCIICYMKRFFDIQNDTTNKNDSLWLKRNFIWIAACLQLLNGSNQDVPKADLGTMNIQEPVLNFDMEKKQIEYKQEAIAVYMENNKNNLTNNYRYLLNRIERAMQQRSQKQIAQGNALDDKNIKVIITLTIRMACKLIEKGFFTKANLPGSLVHICLRAIELDTNGQMKQLIILLQGNSRNEGANVAFPAYKAIEKMIQKIQQTPATIEGASAFINNIRFLARFINIYDANLTRIFSNAVPQILKHQFLKNQTELISWIVCFFQKTSYYLPVAEHQNIVNMTMHVIDNPILMRSCDQFGIVNLMTAMSGYDQNDPQMKDKFKDKLVDKIMENFNDMGQIINMDLLQIYKQYIQNSSMYAKDFVRLHKLLMLKILPALRKWSNDEPASGNKKASALIQFAGVLCGRIFQVKQVDMMCDTLYREWKQEEIDEMVQNMVTWILLNPHNKWKQGQQGLILDQKSAYFNDLILRFFLFFSVKREFRISTLKSMVRNVQILDSCLLDQRFSIKLAIHINKHMNSIFGSLLKLCLSDEEDVKLFMEDLNGIQFLKKRLSMNKNVNNQKQEEKEQMSLSDNGVFQEFQAQKFLSNITNTLKSNSMHFNTDILQNMIDLKKKFHKNQIQSGIMSDEKNKLLKTSGGTAKSWYSDQKFNSTASLYSISYNCQYFFEFVEPIEMQSLMIGLQNKINNCSRPTPEFINLYYGYGGSDTCHLQSIEMARIYDPRFTQANVFGVNFHSLQGPIPQCLSRAKGLRVKFIGFTMDCGWYSGLNDSMKATQLTNTYSDNITFIQVNGFKLKNIGNYLQKIAKTSSKATIDLVSQIGSEQYARKYAEELCKLMPFDDGKLMRSYLLELTKPPPPGEEKKAENTKESNKNDAFFRFITILAEKSPLHVLHFSDMVFQVLKAGDSPSPKLERFFLNLCINLEESKQINQIQERLVSLIIDNVQNDKHSVANRVAKLFLKYLHRRAKRSVQEKKVVINSFKLSHFYIVAENVNDPSSVDQQLQNLVKFFIYPPSGVQTSFSIAEILKSLQSSNKSPSKSFIEIINMGDASLAQNAFEQSEKDILKNIEEGLKQKKDYKAVFTGLLSWTSHPSICNHLAKSGLGCKLYALAKQNITEDFPKLLLDYLLQILRKLVYGHPQLEEELSEQINKDDQLFGSDVPTSGIFKFYQSIVFPLLFGEETLSISFNPYFFRDGINNYLSLYDQPSKKKEATQVDTKEDLPFKLTNFPKEYKKAVGGNFKKVFGSSSLAVLQNYNIGSFEGKFTMGQLSIYSPAFIYGQGLDPKISKNYLVGMFSLTYVDSLFYERLKDQGFSAISCIYIYCKETGQKLHFRWINTGIGNKMITRNNTLYYVGTKEKHFVRFQVKDYSNSGTVCFGESKPSSLKDLNLYCIEGQDQFNSFPWPDSGFKPPLFYSGFNAPYYGNVNSNIAKIFTSKFDFLPAFFRGDENSSSESVDCASCFEVGGSQLLDHPWHNHYSIVSKLNPVWNVPKAASLNFVTQQLFGSIQKCYFKGKILEGNEIKICQIAEGETLMSVDLDIDVSQALGINQKQQNETKGKTVAKGDFQKPIYLPKMGIFDQFSKKAGFHKIALVVQNKVKALPPASRKNQAFPRLQQWLREVEDFSSFPQFDTIFLANTDCRDFILQDVIRGSSVLTKFCEREAKIANAPFDTLGQLFRGSAVGNLRSFAFENKLVVKLIDALAGMTHQIKRIKIGDEQLKKIQQGIAEEIHAESQEVDTLPVFQVPTEDNTKKKKRKGVGYSSSEGKVWDVSAYLQNREKKNQRVASLIDLLVSLLDTEDWHPTSQHMEQFYQSCILPFLENMFSACSLVEMAKDYVLFVAVFKFMKVLLKHDQTIKLLSPIDPHYRPGQRCSLLELMRKLNSLAQIFLSVASKKVEAKQKIEGSNDEKAEKLAATIDTLFKECKEALANKEGDDEEAQKLREALKLPIRKGYPTILGDLRFDYMQIPKDGAKYKHYFESLASGETNPPASKMVRLAQELADLSNALPIDYTNAMFIRVDKDRIDLMKAVICGANGTPYAHGIFQYDLYLPNNYPNTNPKCNLMTTGNSQVRFNPNLYSNGYVCLSLLGTWRGNANENWDPKLSTILQLLLSIQAVVMSEEVYFNEPGYENTAGTPDGERKNEGYTNIVRYCNIKFAMIEMLQKPIKGFEEVIRRHFYLKRDQVMNQISHWIKLSEKNEADYNGLVSSHNWQWCEKFKKSKDAYATSLKEIVLELEKQLKKVQPPSIREISSSNAKAGGQKKKQIVDFKKNVEKLEDVDVTYNEDEEVKGDKAIDIDDEKVKDRWSRYIGAMGVQAVAKQAAATVLVCGAGGVGIEISKNIVLAGCKEFYLWDDRVTTYSDLSAQFFLSHKDVGKNRAVSSLQKLQQLNFYVKCKALDGSELQLDSELINKIDPDVIVITDSSSEEQIIAINKLCRESKGKIRKFILSEVYGLCSRVFTDFGAKFQVLDKNGQELQDVMIKEIREATQDEVPKPKKKGDDDKDFKEQVHRPVVATCLTGARHNYQDGDEILISEVVGMENQKTKKSINGDIFKVTVLKPDIFIINDLVLSEYTKYEQNGIAKQLKQKVALTFEPYEEARKTAKFDANLWVSDFQKMGHWGIMHEVFPLLESFKKKKNVSLLESEDAQNEFIKQAENLIKKKHEAKETEIEWNKQTEYFVSALALTAAGNVNPVCAFMGGFIAQEIVKAITGKFTPISQWFYYDAFQLFPKQPVLQKEQKQQQKKEKEKQSPEQIQQANLAPVAFLRKRLNRAELKANLKNTRADGLKLAMSHKISSQISKVKLFMIGAGAIGCELLKNYAMLGIGSDQTGMIVLTDPDVIQVSNLNRQFLFREKHLRKPKASTAAAAALDMNPELKGRVYARLDKVHNGTEHIYTDKFFEDLTIVTNALDNIAARRYVDSRCVIARTPLLQSGTLGPKGHVQVILPGKTESYGSQEDPENNTDIPQCTLKMFPEETLHCVQWARDLFEKLFSQHPKQIIKVLEPDFKVNDSTDATALRKAIKLLKKRPSNWKDCISMARLKFQKYFVNDILQLLYAYPLDKVNKDGRLFWSSPKRPPHAVKYSPKSKLHSAFIISTAFLIAKIYGIKIDVAEEGKKLRKDQKVRAELANEAENVKVQEFKPDKKKAEDIAKEVQKDENKKQGKVEEQEQVNEEEEKEQMFDVNAMIKQLVELKKNLPSDFKPKPETFEKDDDENGHIDFIHSLANCRSQNYKLEQMEWINVKLKAGRIVPALATTTAAVAGLQALELLKYVAGCTMENQRNVFLNLALPSMTASQPGPPESTELREGLKVNLWDRWEVYHKEKKDNITLGDVIQQLEKEYKLNVRDVMKGNKPIFFYALMSAAGKEKEKQKLLKQSMKKLLDIGNVNEEGAGYSDLTVTFAKNKDDKDILKGIPPVRVHFIEDKGKKM